MHCSQLKAHLFDMHIIDNAQCICGNPREDEMHYFFDCPLYVIPRTILREKLLLLGNFNLRTLLFGIEESTMIVNSAIFEAVHDFIDETKRFN